MRITAAMSWWGILFLCAITSALDAWAQDMPRLVVQTGHSDAIWSVSFSPNGKTVITGSLDKTVRLWDVASGREIRTFIGHDNVVKAVAFSPDGNTFASASHDHTVRLWDVASGHVIRIFSGHAGIVTAVSFSPDGKSIATSSNDKTLRIWSIASGNVVKIITGHNEEVTNVAFSRDGRTIVSASDDKTLRLWDTKNGKVRHIIRGLSSFLTISPDIKTIASATEKDGLILSSVSNGKTLRNLKTFKLSDSVLAFSPDSKTIASSQGNSVDLWDIVSGNIRVSLNGGYQNITALAFSPDGKNVAVASNHTLRMWNIESGHNPNNLGGMPIYAHGIEFNDNEKVFASFNEKDPPRIWDGGVQISGFGEHTNFLWRGAFSPNGKSICAGSWDGKLFVWDQASKLLLNTYTAHNSAATSCAFSPDNKTLVSGGLDKVLRLWDLEAAKSIRSFVGHTKGINSVAFSPDGKSLVSASKDNTLRLWDVGSGLAEKTLIGNNSEVKTVAFSPSGKTLISGGFDDPLRLWDVESGREIKTFGSVTWTESVAFSPDGNTVVSGEQSGELRLWDVASGHEIRRIQGQRTHVMSVAFGIYGKILASSSTDGTIKLWRVSDGAELATLVSFSDGRWVVTDPEGRFDTADLESMPHLHWVMPDDPLTPVPLEAFMKDYYEPRLLARILAGETFKLVRSLTSLNRTQPEVRIDSVVPEGSDPSLVRVTVSAAGATKSYLQDDVSSYSSISSSSREVPRPTAVHDLRLFRDGQVVGYADGKLAEFSASGAAFTKTFTIRLPRAKAGQNVVFSAYAFNDDRVKSETVRSTYKAPALSSAVAGVSGSAKGRAYVISMGVNQHDNSAWNLGYAANDARAVSSRVSADLRKSDQYAEVVPLVLISDGQTQQASKAALRAVLARLAGQPASPADEAALQGVAGAEQLRKAQPDDLVLISFAGHGFADDGGQFYLMPQDTGAGSGKHITDALKAHSIGSEELSLWLRDVDAGDMTMIVDACQSAASVQAEGFKPGPMGSRGLGQLSFDKGMRILAASQSDEFALEDQRLRHGLLTFSLINDGLEAFNADHEPKDSKVWLDEWLKYGVKRVPTLAEEVKSGTVKVANRGPERGAVRVDVPSALDKVVTKTRPAQQPALFDFAKNRRPVVLAAP